MGCGYSSVVTVLDLTPKAAPIKFYGSPHPLETRIVQADIVDRVMEQPDPEEARLVALDEGDFIDGMLGLSDEAAAQKLVDDIAEGELFEDTDFDAVVTSLSCSESNGEQFAGVEWKRPHELCDEPHMFIDGISRSDVKQGILGDCWFLSACAAVAKRPDLIEKVVPTEQVLSGDGYKGVIRIRFWRFGSWVTVIIDDRLPVKDGALLFASCTDPYEFWVAYVEKAYAKLHGSYEAIAGGHALEAFVDLTGGLAEKLDTDSPDLSYRKLRTAFNHGAFITCARKGLWQPEALDRQQDVNGLVQGHAYTVTDVRGVEADCRGCVQMVRVRNPWGDASEWTGAWNDSDEKWQSVDNDLKEQLGISEMADGEFWMEFTDFRHEFHEITIATLGPDFDQDGLSDTPKQVQVLHGRWIRGLNAGGSRNDLEKFALNPQYLLTLTQPDNADVSSWDSDDSSSDCCSVLIGLMQEHRRSERNRELRMLAIAFFIYKSDETPTERLGAEYFLCVTEEGSSGVFTNSREVLNRFELAPGTYVIVPGTFLPHRSRDFMLRVFSLKPFTVQELPPYQPL